MALAPGRLAQTQKAAQLATGRLSETKSIWAAPTAQDVQPPSLVVKILQTCA
jgi:hypothetical protein